MASIITCIIISKNEKTDTLYPSFAAILFNSTKRRVSIRLFYQKWTRWIALCIQLRRSEMGFVAQRAILFDPLSRKGQIDARPLHRRGRGYISHGLDKRLVGQNNWLCFFKRPSELIASTGDSRYGT